MSASAASMQHPSESRPHLDQKPSPLTILIFVILLLAGLGFAAFNLEHDINQQFSL